MESLKRYLSPIWSACMGYRPRVSLQAATLIAFGLAALGVLAAIAPPADFVPGSIARVAYGSSVPQIAAALADEHVIKHPSVLRLILRAAGKSGSVQTGVYRFEKPQNVLVIAYRLIAGDYGLPPVRITFFEGTTARDDALRIASTTLNIPADDFLSVARAQEGYLFPDTYFFQPSTDAKSIVAAMRANFDTKIAPLSGDIQASGHSLSDIVTMASLVEREARTNDDQRMVAGILWNRIDAGMPLQVDAVFGYIFDRDTYSPSYADLKIDSLYNTYTHKGLPPGPISNPGLSAIDAALHPTPSKYLYYLTGRDGKMHYATTYAAHQANLRKYLQ